VSNAGAIDFIRTAFGDGAIAGTLSFLTWFTCAISIALCAKGFAGYLLPLVGAPATFFNTAMVAASVIPVFTALGLLGTRAVGRSELAIVIVKLSILFLFIVLGFRTIHAAWVTPTLSARHAGYLLVSIAALFSIASALNATLFGGANIAYALARNGELPILFERKAWFPDPSGSTSQRESALCSRWRSV